MPLLHYKTGKQPHRAQAEALALAALRARVRALARACAADFRSGRVEAATAAAAWLVRRAFFFTMVLPSLPGPGGGAAHQYKSPPQRSSLCGFGRSSPRCCLQLSSRASSGRAAFAVPQQRAS